MEYMPQIGDIILSDSNRIGAKIVKFFMRSPTIWHELFRWVTNQLEKVEYYHVSMMINDGFSGSTNQADIIEQQSKVQLGDWNSSEKQIIFRSKLITIKNDQFLLRCVALQDLGKGYDVLNCFGKFLTWLTGIKWFSRYIELSNKDICVNRIAFWFKVSCIDNFGVVKHSELTTHMLYKRLVADNDYDIVYLKD